MFVNFFLELRQAKVPVSIKEYLALMEGMDKGVSDFSVDDFYYLSRAILVKDERNLDKFDKVFGNVFKGLEAPVVILADTTTPPAGPPGPAPLMAVPQSRGAPGTPPCTTPRRLWCLSSVISAYS